MASPITKKELKRHGGSLRKVYEARAASEPEERPYWERIEKHGPRGRRKGTPLLAFAKGSHPRKYLKKRKESLEYGD